LLPEGTVKAYFILTFVVLFVFSMQGTIGPLVWLLLAEIFPLKIRRFAMGVCVFMLWMANAAVAFGFPPVVSAIGISASFFIFAGLGVLALIFIANILARLHRKQDCPPQLPQGHSMAIVVAVTDSPEGTHALKAAVAQAVKFDTNLVAVNLKLGPLDISGIPADVKTTIVERTPSLSAAESVLAALERQDDTIELLVIGVMRRSPIGKAVLGSVSQQLILNADVPVLAIKLPTEK